MSPAQNDTFTAVNRLLAAGEMVARGADGLFHVAVRPSTRPLIDRVAADRGVNFLDPARTRASGGAALSVPRVGLWDRYGGSMESGWTRWILEQFEFPFSRVFAPELDAGNLRAKYDTLIFVDGAIPAGVGPGGRGGAGGGGGRGAPAGGRGGAAAPSPLIPAEFQAHIGAMTAERTLPAIRAFLEDGGTVIAIGSSAENLAEYLKLPVANHLIENGQPLPRTKYYVPGSVLRARVETSSPIAAGMEADTDVFFDNSPVWRLLPGAEAAGVRRLAWFESATPLRSGWAYGQAALEDGVIALDARVGQGRALLFGPEILQRAQPHATFKFLFNGIYLPR
jgi:hypothetical protein